MSKDINVRWGWLKIMYIWTIVGAGGFGLGIIVIPNIMIYIWMAQSRSNRIWCYWQRMACVWDYIYIGSTISSQICACSVATTLL